MRKIRVGDVYLGGSGTIYYLTQTDLHWRLLYYNINGAGCHGVERDKQSMTEHLGREIYTYVMNLGDIQDDLNKQRLCK